jgi:hypothetical protein
MCAKCNDDEIYVIAEQILLEGKTLKDFQELEEDDLKRVQTVVNRGVKALSEHNSTKIKTAKRKKIAPLTISRHSTNTAYIYKPKRKTFDISALASKLDLEPFSLSEIAKSSTTSQRKAISEINKKLSTKEITILLSQEPEWVLNTFLEAMSTNQADDITSFLNHDTYEKFTPIELELALAKTSIALTKLFLDEEGISQELNLYVRNYHLNIKQQLKEYSKQLFIKLDFPQQLDKLNTNSWKRLAGITPRTDMAILSYALPREYFDSLLHPLPKNQYEDVMENIKVFQTHLKQDISYYGQIIDTLVNWRNQVIKVTEN